LWCVLGFRRLGFGIPFSLWAVFVINPAFSLTSSPHWYPDPLFRVYTNNIHKGKHGSDQEVSTHTHKKTLIAPPQCVEGEACV
jgi:hypothetical protein